jgi:ankyrin repeat protein
MIASQEGHTAVLAVLASFGADLDALDANSGLGAVHIAVQHGRSEALRELHRLGCNMNIPAVDPGAHPAGIPAANAAAVAAAAAANAAAAVAAALGVGGFGAAMVGGLHDGGMLAVEAALQGAATGSEEHRKCLIFFAEIFRVI